MKTQLFKTYQNVIFGLGVLDLSSCGVQEQKQIENRILKMVQNSDAVIFVSHNEEQILKVCDRVMILSEGFLTYDGKPEAALRYYRSQTPRLGSRSDQQSLGFVFSGSL